MTDFAKPRGSADDYPIPAETDTAEGVLQDSEDGVFHIATVDDRGYVGQANLTVAEQEAGGSSQPESGAGSWTPSQSRAPEE